MAMLCANFIKFYSQQEYYENLFENNSNQKPTFYNLQVLFENKKGKHFRLF